MRTILLAGAVATAIVAMGLTCGCSATSRSSLVANPAYQAWADFEPGSWATTEGIRTTSDQTQKVRITQRLVERADDRIILDQTVTVLSAAASQPAGLVAAHTAPAAPATPATQPVVARRVEPKMIQPADYFQTRPEAVTKDLPPETIVVKGLTLTCRVIDVEIHAAFAGPLPTYEDSHLRRWLSPAVPGGTVRITMERCSTSHALELAAQLVDYKVVRRAQP